MRGRYRLFAATRTPVALAPGAGHGAGLPGLVLVLRAGPAHGSRGGLERARPLSRGVDAEARDRGRAAARAPRRARSGTRLAGVLWRMLVYSDDRAANELLEAIGGSTSGGSTRVNAMMRALGLADSDMYGGYLIEDSLAAPRDPARDRQPPFVHRQGHDRLGPGSARARTPSRGRRPRSADLALSRRVHALRRALPPLSPRARAHARRPDLRARRRRHAPAQGGVDLEGQARHRSPVLAATERSS